MLLQQSSSYLGLFRPQVLDKHLLEGHNLSIGPVDLFYDFKGDVGDIQLSLLIDSVDKVTVKRLLSSINLSRVDLLGRIVDFISVLELRLSKPRLYLLYGAQSKVLVGYEPKNDHVLGECLDSEVLGLFLAPVLE